MMFVASVVGLVVVPAVMVNVILRLAERLGRWTRRWRYQGTHRDDFFTGDEDLYPQTERPADPEPFLSAPRIGGWLPARPRIRIPCAETVLDLLDARQRDWLDDLLAFGYAPFKSADEYIANRRREAFADLRGLPAGTS